MKLIIEDDEGRRTVVPLFRDELIIGRAEGSPVRLTEKDVSRRHAKLLRRSGRVYVEDLGSFTGVRVNGDWVHGPRLVREGDLIEISQYDLTLQGGPDE
jgi:pSer/pThr/pTyr-binding forkhead associated (FHA) protein